MPRISSFTNDHTQKARVKIPSAITLGIQHPETYLKNLSLPLIRGVTCANRILKHLCHHSSQNLPCVTNMRAVVLETGHRVAGAVLAVLLHEAHRS